MDQQTKPTVMLDSVEQVGVIVRNLEKAVEFYSSTFGWGPFEILEIEHRNYFYRGHRSYARLKVALAQAGPVQVELIEPVEGVTPHSEFLKEKGEGANHVNCGLVEDLDNVLAKLAEDGIEPAYRARFKVYGTEVDVVYLDSGKIGGLMIELYQVLSMPETS